MPETPITDDYEEDTYTFVDDMVSGEISISKPRSQYSIFDSPQLIDSSNSPFITKDVRSPEQKKIKLGETLEKEAKQIITLWKYMKNLILNLKLDFELSCRLLKFLSKETFDHHTEDLPKWLVEIMKDWYDDLEETLCTEI